MVHYQSAQDPNSLDVDNVARRRHSIGLTPEFARAQAAAAQAAAAAATASGLQPSQRSRHYSLRQTQLLPQPQAPLVGRDVIGTDGARRRKSVHAMTSYDETESALSNVMSNYPKVSTIFMHSVSDIL